MQPLGNSPFEQYSKFVYVLRPQPQPEMLARPRPAEVVEEPPEPAQSQT